MKSTNKIRPIVLALIEKENKLLVFKATDEVSNKEFYRPLGGGIKFGETSHEALTREFQEEIGTELINIKLIHVFENIFIYEDIKMHELVFLCKAQFKDKKFYAISDMKINDSKNDRKAVWMDKEFLKKQNFYPDGIKEYL